MNAGIVSHSDTRPSPSIYQHHLFTYITYIYMAFNLDRMIERTADSQIDRCFWKKKNLHFLQDTSVMIHTHQEDILLQLQLVKWGGGGALS